MPPGGQLFHRLLPQHQDHPHPLRHPHPPPAPQHTGPRVHHPVHRAHLPGKNRHARGADQADRREQRLPLRHPGRVHGVHRPAVRLPLLPGGHGRLPRGRQGRCRRGKVLLSRQGTALQGPRGAETLDHPRLAGRPGGRCARRDEQGMAPPGHAPEVLRPAGHPERCGQAHVLHGLDRPRHLPQVRVREFLPRHLRGGCGHRGENQGGRCRTDALLLPLPGQHPVRCGRHGHQAGKDQEQDQRDQEPPG